MHPHAAHEDKRRRERALSVTVLAGLLLPAALWVGNHELVQRTSSAAPLSASVAPAPLAGNQKQRDARERAEPRALAIPALALEASVLPVGLNADGTVEVPTRVADVGWYRFGALPGERGSTVMLGHRSSWTGPGIFREIGTLRRDDEIEVALRDGTTLTYRVTSVATYPQASFPTELVYGPTETPTLRLVTCSGSYLPRANRFTHNTVVSAELL